MPYPADYGGVIDVFYKLKALKEDGYKVFLHCYHYGRKEQSELENLAEKVYYYPRHAGRSRLFVRKPYIVASRDSDMLLTRLQRDNYPILYEGLHCCHSIDHKSLENRIKIVRAHNIEHDYYENLAEVESNVFKRYYFYNEASKLKKYEKVLKKANYVAAISPKDQMYFQKKYKKAVLVPAFHPYREVGSKTGRGDFVLYHGNLGVGENNEAALYLCKKVFPHIKHPVVIAGNKASQELKAEVEKLEHVKLESPVGFEKLQSLIRNAQVNVLPTFQATGIKLKLLAALYAGRHVVVNYPMVEGNGLEELCHLENNPMKMAHKINQLFSIDFTGSEIEERKEVLYSRYSNRASLTSLKPLFV